MQTMASWFTSNYSTLFIIFSEDQNLKMIVIPDSYLVKDKLRINYLKKSTIPVYRASKSLAGDLIFDIEVEKTPDSWSSAVCCFHSYRSF